MKNRDELVNSVYDGSEAEEHDIFVAVDSTVYAVLEYIDDAINQSADHPITQRVLKLVRSNIAQLGRDV